MLQGLPQRGVAGARTRRVATTMRNNGALSLIVPRLLSRIEVQGGVKEDNNIELLSSRGIFHIGASPPRFAPSPARLFFALLRPARAFSLRLSATLEFPPRSALARSSASAQRTASLLCSIDPSPQGAPLTNLDALCGPASVHARKVTSRQGSRLQRASSSAPFQLSEGNGNRRRRGSRWNRDDVHCATLSRVLSLRFFNGPSRVSRSVFLLRFLIFTVVSWKTLKETGTRASPEEEFLVPNYPRIIIILKL